MPRPAFQVGNLRHEVTIQTKVEARAADGGFSYSWTDAATRFALVERVGGTETVEGERVTGLVDFKVTMRLFATLNPDDRIEFTDYDAGSATRRLNVIRVDQVQQAGWLTVAYCKEEQPTALHTEGV